jgi:hypothetical protein
VNLAYGIQLITFYGDPDSDFYATTTFVFALTIEKIPTETIPEVESLTVTWGWVGNITFYYHNLFSDIGVETAFANYRYGEEAGLYAIELGGGWYLASINTTLLIAGEQYTLVMEFSLANYEASESGIPLVIEPRTTGVTVLTPVQNQVEGDSMNLIVPMGDSIEILFQFNDTDLTAPYLGGGLSAANISEEITRYLGPSFGGYRSLIVEDLGNGLYLVIFDTSDLTLYEYTDGMPQIYQTQYFLTVGLEYPHRDNWDGTVRIRVVNRPTEIVVTQSDSFNLINGDEFVVSLYFNDTWSGEAVDDAIMTSDFGESVIVEDYWPDGDGYYSFRLRAVSPSSLSVIELSLAKRYHVNHTVSFFVTAQPNDFDILVQQGTTIGLPIMFVAVMLLGLYVRVWSVPKRIRQINGQIKALRKGKMPKAIPGVSSRQQLVADLFNDTYEELKLTRTSEQMPDESIVVAVPEMGELLVQLTLLTNLSPEELEEFKADIAKMRLSEQAAFVKEVIMQEAIRAARRDGITVDEVIEKVQAEASRRLAGLDVDEAPTLDVIEPTTDPVVLVTEEEPEPEVDEKITPADFEEAVTTDDRLSPYEIEELRKELEGKGVPAHEIDTIIEQARVLPRDLVEELIRSLEKE